MFSAFQRPLPYSYTILIVTCFCCMANIKFTDGTTRNKRSPPTLGGEFVKRLVTIPMVAGGVALTDKFKGEKRAKQVEGMKNESNIVEQQKGEEKNKQNNFSQISQILMKSPTSPKQQTKPIIGKGEMKILEMATAGKGHVKLL